jgi:hypothetical protein
VETTSGCKNDWGQGREECCRSIAGEIAGQGVEESEEGGDSYP